MLKFWLVTAPWCTTCKPIKEAISNGEVQDIEVKDMEVDFEELKGHNVRSVPTLLILDGNSTVGIIPCGNMGLPELVDKIDEQVDLYVNG